VLLKGNYGPLLPYLVQMHIDQLVLEMRRRGLENWMCLRSMPTRRNLAGRGEPTDGRDRVPAMIVQRVKEVLKFFDPRRSISTLIAVSTFAERCVNTSGHGISQAQGHQRGGSAAASEFA
jgi:5-methyltetrahydropteroyltriglutamate--homocysteine methyltransferase